MIDHTYAWMYLATGECEKLSDSVPLTFKEAISSNFAKEWRDAINLEFDSLFRNDVWAEVPSSDKMLIRGKKLVSTKWVFTVKYQEHEEYAKARLVV